MKALTLHQPWASLIALGVKSIETRSWSTQYRGPLAIHAAATMPSYDKRYVSGVGVRHEAGFLGGDWRIHLSGAAAAQHVNAPEPKLHPEYGEIDWPCPIGAIVATCTLVDVVPMWAPNLVERPEKGGVLVGTTTDRDRLLAWTPDRPVSWDVTDQRPYGDFAPGRFAWLLADVVPVGPPVPFKGGQGLTKTWEP